MLAASQLSRTIVGSVVKLARASLGAPLSFLSLQNPLDVYTGSTRFSSCKYSTMNAPSYQGSKIPFLLRNITTTGNDCPSMIQSASGYSSLLAICCTEGSRGDHSGNCLDVGKFPQYQTCISSSLKEYSQLRSQQPCL